MNTAAQYAEARLTCRTLFAKKMQDYGTAWRIMRLPSLTDQLYIKAKRIRSIEQNGMSKVDEGIEPEFIALVNYAYMALIQNSLGLDGEIELPHEEALSLYDKVAEETRELMEAKNHDYGEAWRDMRVSSLTDLILMKLHRIKQIEDNEGETQVSEGVQGGYADIANYSLFALIKMKHETE
ncbi:MAG: DUF1599 domain-containing protein [Saprospiraceae bacterium]